MLDAGYWRLDGVNASIKHQASSIKKDFSSNLKQFILFLFEKTFEFFILFSHRPIMVINVTTVSKFHRRRRYG